MKSINPITLRKRRVSKQGYAGLNNVTMLTFNDPILLMGMRTRNAMYDACQCYLKEYLISSIPHPNQIEKILFYKKINVLQYVEK